MQLPTRNLLCVLAGLLSTLVVSAQILGPLSAVPNEQRDALSKRLDGYVEAYQHRNWEKLYGFISTVGKGSVDMQTFVADMSANHGEDFAQYPDLQAFTAYRTGKNGDGYDIYGCAKAVREDQSFLGIAEVHSVFEREDWFFRDGPIAIHPKKPVRRFQTRIGNPIVRSSGIDQCKSLHTLIESVV